MAARPSILFKFAATTAAPMHLLTQKLDGPVSDGMFTYFGQALVGNVAFESRSDIHRILMSAI